MGGAAGAFLWKDIQRRIKTTNVDVAPVQGGALNMLVIGTDSRDFIDSKEDRKRFGDVGGNRADTIILVQAVPSEQRAVLVQFPRDLWVSIPGQRTGKINRSFQSGAGTVIDTVQQLTGVQVNHYVQVDFDGFRRIVDAIGGIDVCLDERLVDSLLNFKLSKGVNHLNGEQALSFVRSRHSSADGDFGRIKRQQQFLRAVVSKLTSKGVLLHPVRMHALAQAVAANLTTDQSFNLLELLRVAKNVRTVTPEQMKTYTVPGEVGTASGESVVLIDRDRADLLFGALREVRDPDEAMAPQPVNVSVDDRSGRGIGEVVATDLRDRGFTVTSVTSGDTVQKTVDVISPRAQANDAKRVVAVVPGSRVKYGGTGITLVIGSRYKGLSDAPKGEEPHPSGPCAGFKP